MTVAQIAQVISIVAMVINIFSYQSKEAKGVILCQLFSGTLFAVSFLMLGAYSGGILNIVAVIRAILFVNRDRFKMEKPIWIYAFTAVYLLCYGATFLIFDKEPIFWNLVIEFLPVIGLVATTIAFQYHDAKIIRRYSLICSCAWLIYNISARSIGAICCEAFSIVSIFVGMIRFDIPQKAAANTESRETEK